MGDSQKRATEASSTASGRSLGKIDHVKKLSNDLGSLLDASRRSAISDVTFIVENRRFPCHRVVLAARCPYFEALLYGGMKESLPGTEIPIHDTTANAFAQLLSYVYTGKVDLLNGSDVTQVMIHDLLSLAHKYQFVDLQMSIADYLEIGLTTETVCYTFDVASLYRLDGLRRTCLTFLDQNAVKVMQTDSFLDLSLSAVEEMLQRVSFFAAEIEVFRGVQRWVERNAVEVGPEGVASIVGCVRLALVSLEDLLIEVRQSELVTADDVLDAIQKQTIKAESPLDYRGLLVPEANLATPKYSAIVLSGDMRENLLNGEEGSYSLDSGFTCHSITSPPSSEGIVIALGEMSLINTIRFHLWDKDVRSYSYFVEVSVDRDKWEQIIDYTNYPCRSWQTHYFDSRVVRYIRIVGTNNTMNKLFHIVSFECCHTENTQPCQSGIIVPEQNVASTKFFATVPEGVCRHRNALVDGNAKNYDWDSGYTCHQLGNGAIVVQLAQPYVIGSCRLLLWDCDDRHYSYYIEASTDNKNWTVVADKQTEQCRSWQTLSFPPIPVVYFRIVGTKNTANEVFHCVHFESPAAFPGTKPIVESVN